MSRSFNEVILLGNLTRDPELRSTPSGASVVNVSIALNRSYKDASGEWREETDYVDVVCWSNLADRVHQFLGKGSKVLISGRIQSRSWEQDGQKRSKLEVVANSIIFLDSKPKDKDEEPSTSVSKEDLEKAKDDKGNINLADIPF